MKQLFYKKSIGLFAIMLVTSGLLVNCNQDFENRLVFDNDADTTVHNFNNANKVLYVLVDGGIGKVIINESLKDDIYPNLSAITKKALFTGNSLSDTSNYIPGTYASMLTGVLPSKHGVAPGNSNNQLDQYPSFITRIKETKGNIRAAAFVQSDFIYDNLLDGADQSEHLTSDDAVEEATLEELANQDATVVLTQYMGLYKAGEQSGYGPDSPAYIAALKKLDTYLGRLRDALKSRPGYASENWLIVVASNKGGHYELQSGEDDESAFSDTERNAFTLFYNEKFGISYRSVPDLRNYQVEAYSLGLSSINNLLGSNAAYGIVDTVPAQAFDLGTAGDYTIQFKAYVTARGSQLPAIFGKSPQNSSASPNTGWAVVLHGDNGRKDWDFRIQGTSNSAPEFELNTWNTFTIRLYDSAGKRFLRTYTNGAAAGNPTDITGKQGTTVSTLRVGGLSSYGGFAARLKMIDIRFYNIALPEEYIASDYCSTLVNDDNLYYGNLIGYWPGMALTDREKGGTKFLDLGPNRRDIEFPSGLTWVPLTLSASETICPTIPSSILHSIPNGEDIPLFIYNWMGITKIEELDLDGVLWTPPMASGN